MPTHNVKEQSRANHRHQHSKIGVARRSSWCRPSETNHQSTQSLHISRLLDRHPGRPTLDSWSKSKTEDLRGKSCCVHSGIHPSITVALCTHCRKSCRSLILTRGHSAKFLAQHSQWWEAPSFLQLMESEGPATVLPGKSSTAVDQETRKSTKFDSAAIRCVKKQTDTETAK